MDLPDNKMIKTYSDQKRTVMANGMYNHSGLLYLISNYLKVNNFVFHLSNIFNFYPIIQLLSDYSTFNRLFNF